MLCLPSPSIVVTVNAARCSAGHLGFRDIEKELAVKLSDEHVGGVLQAIDAVSNLKVLRLTNCINITGAGLEPLSGSTIIEKIDLSLVGDHRSSALDPEPPLSCTEVLPILDSIIEREEECALKLLIFPSSWRQGERIPTEFYVFLTRYNEFLCSRGNSCMACNCNLPEDDEGQMMYLPPENAPGFNYGAQSKTCYDCMKQYCEDCQDGEYGYFIEGLCWHCERMYCRHCKTSKWCKVCDEVMCLDCMDFTDCSNCGDIVCYECVFERSCTNNCGVDNIIWCRECDESCEYERTIRDCDNCDEAHCDGCRDSDENAVKTCGICGENLCGPCREKKCSRKVSTCSGCYHLAFSSLLKVKDRMQNEINAQRSEIDELEYKVKELTAKLEELE